jgi:glycosyltransferase involved in cell wall biosynthesis
MELISICIPTYEMKGKGALYLEHSFQKLLSQTYKNFEVIVSDHSQSNLIKDLCDKWNPKLDIKHIFNDKGRGVSSANINNAIKHATGDVIKLLWQDDFLYDDSSLEAQLIHLVGSCNHWNIGACAHTKDGKNINNPFYPKYHDNIQYGENTISSPSVLMFYNKDLLFFDENLFWLMDVDMYKRLYDKFGLPSICNYLTIVNRDHDDSVSKVLATKQRRDNELEYIISKYSKPQEERENEELILQKMLKSPLNLDNVTLITLTSVRLENHIKALELSSKYIKFGAIKIISDIKPTSLPNHIEHHYIDKMSNIDEWSYAAIYKLGDYVDTEFAILIHDDGFIINPDSWKPEFLNYDYIGAPWPIPNDNFSYRDINGELIRVGNSVSLRSKKLIDLPNKLNLEWKAFHGYYNEDGFITVNYRHIYKQHGCKFADIDIAKYFSHETPIPETEGIKPFAFHGKNNIHTKLI